MPRPLSSEYHDYFSRYVDLVSEAEILPVLESQVGLMRDLLQRARGKEEFAYAPGKWSVRQVVGHISDTERVFAFRALVFGRADSTELAGFDENAYAANSRAGHIALADLVDEFVCVRQASVHLLKGLSEQAWAASGVANHRTITVRALAYLMAGHVRHHLNGFATNYGL